FRPGDDRDGAALDRRLDEVLAVEYRPLERAEHAAARDLAMIDGKAGHFGIQIDVRDIAQPHSNYSSGCVSWTNGSTSDMSGSRDLFGRTPSIGAIRLTATPNAGPIFQAAVWKP